MAKYNVKLKNKKEVAEETMAFYLEKPSEFEFKAGQFLRLTIINPPETDSEGNTRAFSITSAPHEPELIIATRMRDTAFKKVIKNLEPNSEIEINGPMGSFNLHSDESRPAVFLIGGIGITPVRSIIFNATKNSLPHKIYLFYSNRRPEDTAFLEELTNLQSENPNFNLIATMTDMDKSQKEWNGETGYINDEMIKKYISDIYKPIYYLAGPEQMVSIMRKILNDLEIKDDNIKTEEFPGY